MSASKIKKIIGFCLLMLFLVSFILPFGTILAADPTITISANKTEMKIGESIEIQVEVSHTPSVNVTLTSSPADATLSHLEKTSLGAITVHMTSTYLSGQPEDLGDHPIIFQTVTDKTTYTLQASAVSLANPFAGTGTILSNTITIEVKEPEKWWYTYKTIGATGNFKGCTTPDSFSSEIKCTTSKNLIVDGTTNIIVTDCTESETKPIPLLLCLATIVPDPSPTTTEVKTELNYYPLAPLTGVGEKCEKDPTTEKEICVKLAPEICTTDSAGKETCRPCTADDPASECKPGLGFAGYLNAMIKIFIGICAVLAMIMIVMGGIQYMTSELVSGKAAGKEQITHAILGLLLALGAYAILNTINPNLLDVSLGKLETATVTLTGAEIEGPNPGNGNCNPTIETTITTAGEKILAKAPGAKGPSCWGGASAAYVAAGYALTGGHSNGCPTSISPGDVLTYNNDNIYDTQGFHSVIFDSILSNGNWKVWSQPNSDTAMDSIELPASTMSAQLQYSWKPVVCPTGQVAQMGSTNNNNAICVTSGASTPTAEELTSVDYNYTKAYFVFVIDGFDNTKQYRYRVYEAGTANKLVNGDIDKNLMGNKLSLDEYNKIRTKEVDITAYNVSGSLIGMIEDYQM